MKIFVAQHHPHGHNSDRNYHKANNGEILVFPHLTHRRKYTKKDYGMVGITSKKSTSKITVKDVNISVEYYKELISEYIESQFTTKIEPSGKYTIDTHTPIKYDVNELLSELLFKAEQFNECDNLAVFRRGVRYANTFKHFLSNLKEIVTGVWTSIKAMC